MRTIPVEDEYDGRYDEGLIPASQRNIIKHKLRQKYCKTIDYVDDLEKTRNYSQEMRKSDSRRPVSSMTTDLALDRVKRNTKSKLTAKSTN